MKFLLSFSCILSISTLFAQQVDVIIGDTTGAPILVSIAPPDSIVNFPDTEAQYPGGPDSLAEFIFVNFILPDDDPMDIEFNDDHVYLSFIVEKDGSLTDIVVEKGVNVLYDSICVAVVKLMPNWVPAQKNGIAVRSLMRLPISIDDAIMGTDIGDFSENCMQIEPL